MTDAGPTSPRAAPFVDIHYRRLPDRDSVFRQRLVSDGTDVKITLAHPVALDEPVRIHGESVLEPGADAVWFTYPGLWHDIGRFHTADGRFTGIYANVLTPPRIDGPRWDTTDLFLDVWLAPGGQPNLLDEDQLEDALAAGWISEALATRAREEAASIMEAAGRGKWPPPIVAKWTRERALAALSRP